jgi:hypothetical protein
VRKAGIGQGAAEGDEMSGPACAVSLHESCALGMASICDIQVVVTMHAGISDKLCGLPNRTTRSLW